MRCKRDHLADLKASGLSDATIEMMQVYSVSPAQIPKLLNRDLPQVESALAFPYFDAEGKANGFMRVKVFPAIKDEGGHKIKYLQKKNTTPHLYILPSIATKLTDPKIPLYIVEGEKKTAKAVEIGWTAIGIGGIWNWVVSGKKELLADFNAINLWRRSVFIVPDSDTWTTEDKSEHLRRGAYFLGKELRGRGAAVGFLKLC